MQDTSVKRQQSVQPQPQAHRGTGTVVGVSNPPYLSLQTIYHSLLLRRNRANQSGLPFPANELDPATSGEERVVARESEEVVLAEI
jgi:hypothetical protein